MQVGQGCFTPAFDQRVVKGVNHPPRGIGLHVVAMTIGFRSRLMALVIRAMLVGVVGGV